MTPFSTQRMQCEGCSLGDQTRGTLTLMAILKQHKDRILKRAFLEDKLFKFSFIVQKVLLLFFFFSLLC